jgi:hypothetical protein
LDILEHSGDANWTHKNQGDYQRYLKSQCQYFGYIRDLANAIKHAENEKTQMVGLANTKISTTSPAFQASAFQSSAFQTQYRTMIVSQTSAADQVGFEKPPIA